MTTLKELNPIILNKDIKVNRIINISDVHIKNRNDRETEYNQVFNLLYGELDKLKILDTDLIILSGDILDSGDSNTPYAIETLKNFYHKLSSYTSTITYIGNHEWKGTRDALTPIIDLHFKSKYKNYFLLESNIYQYGNLVIFNTKFDAEKSIKSIKIKNKICIATFHGIISGCKLANEYNARSRFALKDFGEYDYAIFGDCHKHQFLNKSKKNAWFAGSLISQSTAETTYPHGIVVLDLIKKKEPEFIIINNIFKKMDLIIDDSGKISNYNILDIYNSTKQVEINFIFESKNKKDVEKIKNEFIEKGIEIVSYIENEKYENITDTTVVEINGKSKTIFDIVKKNDFIDFYIGYLKDNEKDVIKNINENVNIKKESDDSDSEIDDDIIDYKDVRNTMNECMTEAKIPDELKNSKKIEIHEMRIDNIMSYGENVIITFQENGIYGCSSDNGHGKSTIVELFSLVLFGATPRCNTPISFLRNGATRGQCSVKISVNDELYEIRRLFILKPTEILDKKETAKTCFIIKKYTDIKRNKFTIISNEKSLIPEKEIRDVASHMLESKMNKYITDNIIEYDDIYEIFVISQGRDSSFLKNKKKKEMLFKMTNLSFLDKIVEKSKNMKTNCKSSLTNIIKKSIPNEYLTNAIIKSKNTEQSYKFDIIKKNVDVKYNEYISKDKKINDEYESIQTEFNEKSEELIKYKERLSNYKDYEEFEDIDIEELTDELDELQTNIKNNDNKLKKEVLSNDNELKKLNTKLKKYKNIEDENDEFEKNKKDIIIKLNKDIKELNKQMKEVKNKVKSEKQINKIHDENIKLIDDINIIEKVINEINYKIKILTDKSVFINYKKYFDKNNIIEKYKIQIDAYTEIKNKYLTKKDKNIKFIDEEINKLNEYIIENSNELEKIEQYNYDYENFDFNQDLHLELEKNITKLNKIKEQYTENDKCIIDYKNNEYNMTIEKQINIIEEQLLKKNKETFDKYDKYIELNDSYEDIEKKNNILKIKLEKQINENNCNTVRIKEINQIIEKINKNKEKYEKYCDVKNMYEKKNKEYYDKSEELNKIKNKKQKNDNESKTFYDKYIVIKSRLDECEQIKHRLNNLKLIYGSLNKNGIADKLLKDQILVKLQKLTNEMCDYIGHERIYFKYYNTKEGYNIIVSSDTARDISLIGGFKHNLSELIIKTAFLSINTYIKCDLLIIDELFDASSENNKTKSLKLLEFLKKKYKKMLLVSHNPDIKPCFDIEILINKNITGNTIKLI